MTIRTGLAFLCTMTIAGALPPASQSAAQQPGASELELTGRVLRVYSSVDGSDATRLVQLQVRGVTLKDDLAPRARSRFPAPGESALVVVNGGGLGQPALPSAGDVIRATVSDSEPGLWTASGSPWFETTQPASEAPQTTDAGPPRTSDPKPQLVLRGMTCEAKAIRGRIACEVVKVDDAGPAHDAGLQVGDVIVAVAGKPITSLSTLRQQAAENTPLLLAVVDVNSGKLAEVELAPAAKPPADAPPGGDATDRAKADPAATIAQALGITLEPTGARLRAALKVVSVDRTKAGADAGLEPGDVIVAVEQTRVSSLEEFAGALPPGGGKITLTVRDVRNGSEVPIDAVAASVAQPDRPATKQPSSPPPAGAGTAASADSLGLVTELTFYEEEAAVRIVSVAPGSAASRAGLRPGWIILKAGGASVMHPDDLAKAVAGARGRLELRVIDSDNKRSGTVTLEL